MFQAIDSHPSRVTVLALVAILGGVGGLTCGVEPAQGPTVRSHVYQHCLSSGAFGIPNGTVSLDWTVLNNSPEPQKIRVSVYQLGIGTTKTAIESLEHLVQPYCLTHNANGENGGFVSGKMYEVVLETEDDRVLPTVEAWSTRGATIIPGTRISPRDFIDLRR